MNKQKPLTNEQIAEFRQSGLLIIKSQDCAVLTQLVWLQVKVKIFDVDSCPHLD